MKKSFGQQELLAWALALAMFVFGLLFTWQVAHAAGLAIYLGLLALILIRVLLTRRHQSRTFLARLREPAPEGLIEYTARLIARAPTAHTPALQTISRATIHALYGQHGRAFDELDADDWSRLPGWVRSLQLQARGLIHYLAGDDVAAGLRDTRQAAELWRGSWMSLLAPQVDQQLRLQLVLGELATTGHASAQLAAELGQRGPRNQGPLLRVLRLWGAVNAHATLGDEARADSYRREVQQLAPHCSPLQRLQLSMAAPEPVAEGQHMCANHPAEPALAHCVRCGNFACATCRRAASPDAWLCIGCHDNYRALRQRLLVHESRLRALGLFIQAAAVGFILLEVLSLSLMLPAAHGQFGSFTLGFIWSIAMGAFFFWQGRSLRLMRVTLNRWPLITAILLLPLVPVGTALGGYVLWLTYSSTGRELASSEHQRARSVTPEIAPRNPWPPVLLASFGLAANFVLLVGLVNYGFGS